MSTDKNGSGVSGDGGGSVTVYAISGSSFLCVHNRTIISLYK
jgi:hypothetical protein